MSGKEERRVRRSHGEKGHSRIRSHLQPVNEETIILIPDRPATVDALRDARLRAMSTPTEKRSKMLFEFAYDRQIKPNENRREEKRSKRSGSVASSGVKGEPVVSKSKSSKQPRERTAAHNEEEDYVYSSAQRVPEEAAGRPATASTNTESKTRPDDVERSKTKRHSERRGAERRNSAPVSSKKDSNATSTIRPPLRKSTTNVSRSLRPEPRRSATEVGSRVETDSTSHVETTKKAPSILGTFLSSRPNVPERKVPCLTCGADDIPVSKSAKLPCSHRMCHSCLKRIFKLSITDPAHMPPRCCTDASIDLKHVNSLFNDEFKKTWNRKYKEYHAKNRIYCPKKGCGQWIQPKHIYMEQDRRIGRCATCKTHVCGICGQKAHKSKECPEDPATKRLVELAKEAGWQKCYKCSAMVELKEGCNHMTCRCTAEFCMVCGLKWKSCDCPWFNYEQVDAHMGNPVRYQEELDLRREQERRDEIIARRLQGLRINRRNLVAGNNENRDNNINVINELFGPGNGAAHQMNQNFVQQARDALTANYANAEQAARGLLNGFFAGRDNPPGDFPAPPDPAMNAPQGAEQNEQPPPLRPAGGLGRTRTAARRRQEAMRNHLGRQSGNRNGWED